MTSDLRDQIAHTIHTGPFEYLRDSKAVADAILALPAIAAGQAAIALLTGDRRDEAEGATERAIDRYAHQYPAAIAEHALDALAALLPNGA